MKQWMVSLLTFLITFSTDSIAQDQVRENFRGSCLSRQQPGQIVPNFSLLQSAGGGLGNVGAALASSVNNIALAVRSNRRSSFRRGIKIEPVEEIACRVNDKNNKELKLALETNKDALAAAEGKQQAIEQASAVIDQVKEIGDLRDQLANGVTQFFKDIDTQIAAEEAQFQTDAQNCENLGNQIQAKAEVFGALKASLDETVANGSVQVEGLKTSLRAAERRLASIEDARKLFISNAARECLETKQNLKWRCSQDGGSVGFSEYTQCIYRRDAVTFVDQNGKTRVNRFNQDARERTTGGEGRSIGTFMNEFFDEFVADSDLPTAQDGSANGVSASTVKNYELAGVDVNSNPDQIRQYFENTRYAKEFRESFAGTSPKLYQFFRDQVVDCFKVARKAVQNQISEDGSQSNTSQLSQYIFNAQTEHRQTMAAVDSEIDKLNTIYQDVMGNFQNSNVPQANLGLIGIPQARLASCKVDAATRGGCLDNFHEGLRQLQSGALTGGPNFFFTLNGTSNSQAGQPIGNYQFRFSNVNEAVLTLQEAARFNVSEMGRNVAMNQFTKQQQQAAARQAEQVIAGSVGIYEDSINRSLAQANSVLRQIGVPGIGLEKLEGQGLEDNGNGYLTLQGSGQELLASVAPITDVSSGSLADATEGLADQAADAADEIAEIKAADRKLIASAEECANEALENVEDAEELRRQLARCSKPTEDNKRTREQSALRDLTKALDNVVDDFGFAGAEFDLRGRRDDIYDDIRDLDEEIEEIAGQIENHGKTLAKEDATERAKDNAQTKIDELEPKKERLERRRRRLANSADADCEAILYTAETFEKNLDRAHGQLQDLRRIASQSARESRRSRSRRR